MTPRHPNEDRTFKWVRSHPKSASAIAFLVIALIPASIALREWYKTSGGSTNVEAGIVKGAGIVAVALFVAWRANKRMRDH